MSNLVADAAGLKVVLHGLDGPFLEKFHLHKDLVVTYYCCYCCCCCCCCCLVVLQGLDEPFLEEFHQKIHQASSPEDVIIAEAYLAYLHTANHDDW